jgi:hydrogenase nickel incorporation protein HypA/HybF
MHELGVAIEILRASRRAVARLGPGKIARVRIAVGELSAVEPALLAHAWQAIVADSPHAGAALDVEWRPARQVCLGCGADSGRGSGTWLRMCGECGGVLKVEGGDALDLIQVSFDALDRPEAA